MNIKSLAFLACRLFAFYVMSQIFVWFVYLCNGSALSPAFTAGHYSLFAVVPPVVALVLGIFFWWKAEWLAGRIAGNYAYQEMSAGLIPEDIQTIGFSVVGMFLLADVVPVIASDIGRMLLHQTGAYGADLMPHYIRLGGAFIIAIWLVFGASWLTKLIRKARGL